MRIPVQTPVLVRNRRFTARFGPAQDDAYGLRPSQMDEGEGGEGEEHGDEGEGAVGESE